MRFDKVIGTRSIQNFWFPSILDLILYFSQFASQCHWFRANPSRNDQVMVEWSFNEQREKVTKTVSGILHIASRGLSNLSQFFLYVVVLVLTVVLMGGSSNSDQNWVRYDSLKLAIQNWKTVYGISCIPLAVRPLYTPIPTKFITKLLLDHSPCFSLRFAAEFIQFRWETKEICPPEV